VETKDRDEFHSGQDHALPCSHCSRSIVGIRYRCVNCPLPNFSLCEECEGSGGNHNPDHLFIKIRKPLPHETNWTLPNFYSLKKKMTMEEKQKQQEEQKCKQQLKMEREQERQKERELKLKAREEKQREREEKLKQRDEKQREKEQRQKEKFGQFPARDWNSLVLRVETLERKVQDLSSQ